MTRRPPRWLLLLAAASAAVALIPLGYLLVRTFGAGWDTVASVLGRPRTWAVAANSLALTVAVAGTCLLIGVPAAWLVARAQLPWRRGWLVLLALPLAVPSYVAAYAWLAMFPGMSGFTGSWLVLTLVSTPYVVLPVAAAFRGADAGAEEVARSLGLSPWQAFRRAGLPQVVPAAAAGTLLAALYTLSDFGTVAIMRYDAFPRAIYASYRASFDRTSAAVLALLLVCLALIFVFAEQSSRGSAQRWRSGAGSARRGPDITLGPWRWPAATGLGVLSLLALGVPAWSLIRMLVQSAGDGFDPAGLAQAAAATLAVSALGAVIALALALPVGVLAARYRGTAVRATETGAFMSHVLPGVVVGLSLVFFTLAVVPAAYQSVAVVGFAYGVLFLPKALGSVRTSVAAVPPTLEQQSRSLGQGPLATFRRVTVPLTWPGVLAGGVLAMLTAMKELPATLMLRPTGMETLATQIWRNTEVADYAAAAPYAAALLLLAAVPAFWLSRVVSEVAPAAAEPPATRDARTANELVQVGS
ncbi:MAG: iron(III) transport system permease protein [Actinomycetota bacterium]|nr:iron(III) transport system permease protein [Actinomycetota bacterium]